VEATASEEVAKDQKEKADAKLKKAKTEREAK